LQAAEALQPSRFERLLFVLGAMFFHVLVIAVLAHLPKPSPNWEGQEPVSVKVRVAEKGGDSASQIAPQSAVQKRLAENISKSQPQAQRPSAPRVPASLLPHPPGEAQELNAPLSPVNPAAPPEPAQGLAKWLPRANSSFLQNQRDLGAESGTDASDAEQVLPEGRFKKWREQVVTTEFSTLAYRLDLERRFSEAWGGVRMLPPFSRFSGRTGELIVYNVVINRDGTLRRIVNLSALEQSERDFSSVDILVQEFSDSVFPMNPIPVRIREEPFVVRWSIRFLGTQYSFF
jgi:hypothetical protein